MVKMVGSTEVKVEFIAPINDKFIKCFNQQFRISQSQNFA